MKTRFDFEQEILGCWNVVEDISLLNEKITESEEFRDMDPKHVDSISNFLLGLSTIYGAKFDRCFNTFEELVRSRDIK